MNETQTASRDSATRRQAEFDISNLINKARVVSERHQELMAAVEGKMDTIDDHKAEREFSAALQEYDQQRTTCDRCGRIATKRKQTFVFCDSCAPRNSEIIAKTSHPIPPDMEVWPIGEMIEMRSLAKLWSIRYDEANGHIISTGDCEIPIGFEKASLLRAKAIQDEHNRQLCSFFCPWIDSSLTCGTKAYAEDVKEMLAEDGYFTKVVSDGDWFFVQPIESDLERAK